MKLSALTPEPLPTDLPLTEQVHIGPDLARAACDQVAEWLGDAPLLVADPDTWGAVEGTLDPRLAKWPRHMFDAHPHADDEGIEILRARMEAEGFSGLLAVGAGTINDLCKRAAHLMERPYCVLGTAASMNGYASGIAAILSQGLKTTVPATPPRAIVLDTTLLAAAPAALTRAGIGDLISKPVSDTCWWLADQLEGTGYSAKPGRIVEQAVSEATAAAAGLKARDPEAHGALGRALVLSGVSMVVAGSSSPASGGEHLLSHLWDMEALSQGRETRLHGAQVGVTTCITAALYQRLLALETPSTAMPGPWSQEAERLKRDHGPLAATIEAQAERKHSRALSRQIALDARWGHIREGLMERALPRPEAIRAILDAAGAPSTLEALGADRADTARVLRLARDIRDRITVLDIAFEVGVLPEAAEAVLDEAGV